MEKEQYILLVSTPFWKCKKIKNSELTVCFCFLVGFFAKLQGFYIFCVKKGLKSKSTEKPKF